MYIYTYICLYFLVYTNKKDRFLSLGFRGSDILMKRYILLNYKILKVIIKLNIL